DAFHAAIRRTGDHPNRIEALELADIVARHPCRLDRHAEVLRHEIERARDCRVRYDLLAAIADEGDLHGKISRSLYTASMRWSAIAYAATRRSTRRLRIV